MATQYKFRANEQINSTTEMSVVSQTITGSGEYVGVISFECDSDLSDEILESDERIVSYSRRGN